MTRVNFALSELDRCFAFDPGATHFAMLSARPGHYNILEESTESARYDVRYFALSELDRYFDFDPGATHFALLSARPGHYNILEESTESARYDARKFRSFRA